MKQYRINNQITNKKILVVGSDNKQIEVTFESALTIARESSLDLVEVSDNEGTSICRLLDYSKFLYNKKKTEKEQKAIPLKEMQIRHVIEKHDYDVKLRKVKEFLEGGHKVKVSMRFKGREMQHKDKGASVLKQFVLDVGDLCKADSIKPEEKQLFVILYPTKKKV